jgi:osmotically-inducible protein OsmY
MKTDAQLKKDVMTELEWDPAINASEVGVAVQNGVVTLTGHLDLYAKKYAIEKAVARVEGVKAIAVEMDVKLEPGHKRSDTEIAAAVESALKWHALVPDDLIQVKVEKGWSPCTERSVGTTSAKVPRRRFTTWSAWWASATPSP